MVECTGFENRRGFIALPGFESLPLRHNTKTRERKLTGFFLDGEFIEDPY